MPNSAVAMDARAELACYPRSSFYPLIFRGIECQRSVHYILLSYLVVMSDFQSSQLMLLHDLRDVHPRLADLNKLLRYFLGGLRPTQTARQPLFPPRLTRRVRIYISKNGCFIGGSIPTEIGTSKPTHYATYPKHKANDKLQ